MVSRVLTIQLPAFCNSCAIRGRQHCQSGSKSRDSMLFEAASFSRYRSPAGHARL